MDADVGVYMVNTGQWSYMWVYDVRFGLEKALRKGK